MANTGSAALVTIEGLFMFKESVRRGRQLTGSSDGGRSPSVLLCATRATLHKNSAPAPAERSQRARDYGRTRRWVRTT
jgi:hypothetical protein